MNQPFDIGDRIHELVSVEFCDCNQPDCGNPPRLDPFYPDAVVTAHTERGFMYRYDKPVPFGRAAWGLMTQGGECLEAGYCRWVKLVN